MPSDRFVFAQPPAGYPSHQLPLFRSSIQTSVQQQLALDVGSGRSQASRRMEQMWQMCYDVLGRKMMEQNTKV